MNIWPFSHGDTLKSRKQHKAEAEEAGQDARAAANQLREAILKATAELKATADKSGRQDDDDR